MGNSVNGGAGAGNCETGTLNFTLSVDTRNGRCCHESSGGSTTYRKVECPLFSLALEAEIEHARTAEAELGHLTGGIRMNRIRPAWLSNSSRAVARSAATRSGRRLITSASFSTATS